MISAYCHFVFNVLILSYLRMELQLLKNGRQNSLFRQPMGFVLPSVMHPPDPSNGETCIRFS